MSKILDAIRAAIEATEESRYSICQATGIDQGQMSRLIAGKSGLSVEAVEKLADHLSLEIIIRAKRRTQKTK